MRKAMGIYRGKTVNGEEWVSGYYVHLRDAQKNRESYRIYGEFAESEIDGSEYSFYPDFFEVESHTVGEYTGVNDSKGRMIFEGEIVETYDSYFDEENGYGRIVFVGCEYKIINTCEAVPLQSRARYPWGG